MKRQIAIAAGALAAVGGLTAGLATAHNVVYQNNVSLTKAVPRPNNLAVYKGRVRSPRHGCEYNREVQVFNSSANPDVRVARVYTAPTGKYRVKGDRVSQGDEVYALIETKVLRGDQNHDHVCAVDESPKVTFPQP